MEGIWCADNEREIRNIHFGYILKKWGKALMGQSTAVMSLIRIGQIYTYIPFWVMRVMWVRNCALWWLTLGHIHLNQSRERPVKYCSPGARMARSCLPLPYTNAI